MMTFDDAVRLLSTVADSPALDVEAGALGPLMTVRVTPTRELCANVVDDGVLLVNLGAPGGALFFGPDMQGDEELERWLDEFLAWQAGESDAELVELGAIDDPSPRVAPPEPRSVRGTVMTASEAALSSFSQTDEALHVLAAPFHETNTPLVELDAVWLLMVGLVEPRQDLPK
jgi:hypothetical protein